ncbi:hypothetical protein [Sinomonas humi]|nr:hypothetical protein [Sinomonas humi]
MPSAGDDRGHGETRVEEGHLVALPAPRHDVVALGDAVVILPTIAG